MSTLQFDAFTALDRMQELHPDVEISIRVNSTSVIFQLYVGNGRVSREISKGMLNDSNIDLLGALFTNMLEEIQEYM